MPDQTQASVASPFGPVHTPLTSTVAVRGDELFRITVEMYDEMVESGILGPDDRVELLEGILVKKMPQNDPHVFVSETLRDLLAEMLPEGWIINSQRPVFATDSEPEPDIAVIRGSRRGIVGRKPRAENTELLIEVADTTLERDREKRRLYAREGFRQYWIVNINARQVESYWEPTASGDVPHYAQSQIFGADDEIPFVLDGRELGRLKVAEMFP